MIFRIKFKILKRFYNAFVNFSEGFQVSTGRIFWLEFIISLNRLLVPVFFLGIVTIIGEGASGGALGIGVGDRVLMLENTWYSVISPESCSSILWRSWEYKEQAADSLKLTAPDMKRLKLIDEIVREPVGGAHSNREKTFEIVKNKIAAHYQELEKLSPKELVNLRMDKYASMGVFNG